MRRLVAFEKKPAPPSPLPLPLVQQQQRIALKILNVSATFECYEIHFLPVIAHLTSIISAKYNASIVYIGIALEFITFFSTSRLF